MEHEITNALATSASSIAAQGRLTAYSWKALAGSVVGYCMDGFDMLILGFMLATISTDLRLTNSQAGSLVTWTLVGAVAGGVIFGTLSDHFGRIRVLTWTILIFAVFTFLCASHVAIGTSSRTELLPVSGWAGNSGSAWRSLPKRGQPANERVCRPMCLLAGSLECCYPR